MSGKAHCIGSRVGEGNGEISDLRGGGGVILRRGINTRKTPRIPSIFELIQYYRIGNVFALFIINSSTLTAQSPCLLVAPLS
jgi:hypothetical protein